MKSEGSCWQSEDTHPEEPAQHSGPNCFDYAQPLAFTQPDFCLADPQGYHEFMIRPQSYTLCSACVRFAERGSGSKPWGSAPHSRSAMPLSSWRSSGHLRSCGCFVETAKLLWRERGAPDTTPVCKLTLDQRCSRPHTSLQLSSTYIRGVSHSTPGRKFTLNQTTAEYLSGYV